VLHYCLRYKIQTSLSASCENGIIWVSVSRPLITLSFLNFLTWVVSSYVNFLDVGCAFLTEFLDMGCVFLSEFLDIGFVFCVQWQS
jgi:hypothetical protein